MMTRSQHTYTQSLGEQRLQRFLAYAQATAHENTYTLEADERFSGFLCVRDVPIFSINERDDGNVSFQEPELEEIVAHHQHLEATGHLVPVFEGHHNDDQCRPKIGNLRGFRLGSVEIVHPQTHLPVSIPTIFADICRIKPEFGQRMLEGDLEYRSIEIRPGTPRVSGLSLSSTVPPFFKYANMVVTLAPGLSMQDFSQDAGSMKLPPLTALVASEYAENGTESRVVFCYQERMRFSEPTHQRQDYVPPRWRVIVDGGESFETDDEQAAVANFVAAARREARFGGKRVFLLDDIEQIAEFDPAKTDTSALRGILSAADAGRKLPRGFRESGQRQDYVLAHGLPPNILSRLEAAVRTGMLPSPPTPISVLSAIGKSEWVDAAMAALLAGHVVGFRESDQRQKYVAQPFPPVSPEGRRAALNGVRVLEEHIRSLTESSAKQEGTLLAAALRRAFEVGDDVQADQLVIQLSGLALSFALRGLLDRIALNAGFITGVGFAGHEPHQRKTHQYQVPGASAHEEELAGELIRDFGSRKALEYAKRKAMATIHTDATDAGMWIRVMQVIEARTGLSSGFTERTTDSMRYDQHKPVEDLTSAMKELKDGAALDALAGLKAALESGADVGMAVSVARQTIQQAEVTDVAMQDRLMGLLMRIEQGPIVQTSTMMHESAPNKERSMRRKQQKPSPKQRPVSKKKLKQYIETIEPVLARHGRFACGREKPRQVAERWASLNFTSAEEVDTWLRAGVFSPQTARAFSQAKLSPESVAIEDPQRPGQTYGESVSLGDRRLQEVPGFVQYQNADEDEDEDVDEDGNEISDSDKIRAKILGIIEQAEDLAEMAEIDLSEEEEEEVEEEEAEEEENNRNSEDEPPNKENKNNPLQKSDQKQGTVAYAMQIAQLESRIEAQQQELSGQRKEMDGQREERVLQKIAIRLQDGGFVFRADDLPTIFQGALGDSEELERRYLAFSRGLSRAPGMEEVGDDEDRGEDGLLAAYSHSPDLMNQARGVIAQYYSDPGLMQMQKDLGSLLKRAVPGGRWNNVAANGGVRT